VDCLRKPFVQLGGFGPGLRGTLNAPSRCFRHNHTRGFLSRCQPLAQQGDQPDHRITELSSPFHFLFMKSCLVLIPPTEKRSKRNQLTDPLKFHEGISSLLRFCLLVIRFFLVIFFSGAVPTAQASEYDDVKVLLELESQMAQSWVQRDTQTLEQILADDYT